MDVVKRELGFAEMIVRKGRPKKKKVPQIKMSEVEEALEFEIKMREAATRLLSACSNTQQRLEAGKTLLTSNSRTLALVTALQKQHVKQVESSVGLSILKDHEEMLQVDISDTASNADVSLSDICIPLKWDRIDPAKYKPDNWNYHVFCVVRCGTTVIDSKTFSKADITRENIKLNDTFTLKNLSHDFIIELEFYYSRCEVITKQKKGKKVDQNDEKPPVFAIGATASLTLAHCGMWQRKQCLRAGRVGAPAHITAPSELPECPPLPVLNFFRVEIDVKPHFTLQPNKEGFLDVQHMLGGMPHWVRSWCSLQGTQLKVWKQPEDQENGEPTAMMEINDHMLLSHPPRTTKQRPHLIHISYNKGPNTDQFISTDTKEERILWEIALHKTMIDSSTWMPNKLSRKEPPTGADGCPSPLRSPPPKPPRPMFTYIPSNPCLASYRAQYNARDARKQRLTDSIPKRSKSSERQATAKRARAQTVTKSRRRSRSVESPRMEEKEMLKKERISDATYVSMHKFSRVTMDTPTRPPTTAIVDTPTRPSRPAPRAPSLSTIPSTSLHTTTPPRSTPACTTPSRATSYKTPRSESKRKSPRPNPNINHESRRKSPRLNPVVDQGSARRRKGPAPTPSPPVASNRKKKAPTPSPTSSRTKKGLAPAPKRMGQINNLNTHSPSKTQPGKMNVVDRSPVSLSFLSPVSTPSQSLDTSGSLSPSLDKIQNTSDFKKSCKPKNTKNISYSAATKDTPYNISNSISFDYEHIIDEAFGSICNESTTLSSDRTPVLIKLGTTAPLTSTLKATTSRSKSRSESCAESPVKVMSEVMRPIIEEDEECDSSSTLENTPVLNKYNISSISPIKERSHFDDHTKENVPQSELEISPIHGALKKEGLFRNSPVTSTMKEGCCGDIVFSRIPTMKNRVETIEQNSRTVKDSTGVRSKLTPLPKPKPRFEVVNGKLVPII